VPAVATSPSLADVPGASAILPNTSATSATSAPPAPPAILSAPGISQFDGSIWAESNCGPTSLAMALGALGVKADPSTLRQLANAQMGIADPNVGTSWDSLAAAAHHYNLQTSGLYQNGKVRTWTVDGVKGELAQGHPVLLLVHYRDLPNHPTSTYDGDHYVVALGAEANGSLVYNDPAEKDGGVFTYAMTPDQLEKAWTDTNFGLFRTAMAVYQ
jgi:uncharacterized protein YvpB